MYNKQNEHIPNMQISSREQTLEEYLKDFRAANDLLLAEHSFMRNKLESLSKDDKDIKSMLGGIHNIISITMFKEIYSGQSKFDDIDKLLTDSKKNSKDIKQTKELKIQEEKDKHTDGATIRRLEFLQTSINDLLTLLDRLYICKLYCKEVERKNLLANNEFIKEPTTKKTPEEQTPEEQTPEEQTPKSLKVEHKLLTEQFNLIFNKITECAQEMRELGQEPQKNRSFNPLIYI